MAFEPINIFSHRIDPRGVLQVLRAMGSKVDVVGPDDDWQQATIYGPKRLLRKPLQLTFGHNSTSYDGPEWSRQTLGMAGYFSRFPEVPHKPDIMRAIHSFRFILSLPQFDLDIHSRDERLQWLFAVCQQLDGVIFTPSSLRDAAGRVLIHASGEYDPLSVLPAVPDAAMPDGSLPGEDEEEIEPPSAARVARRALAFAAVTNRSLIENEQGDFNEPDEIRLAMLDWIDELGIGDELEPEEWKALQRPVGKLARQSMINGVWRLEGLAVLLWALKRCELPKYDELVTPGDLFNAIGGFDVATGRDMLLTASLRPESELIDLQTQILALHWRLRDFSLRPQPMDFVTFSKKCWFGSFDLAPFEIQENDLAIGGLPIIKADDEAFRTCQSAAMERHVAINWLLGGSRLYSQTDCST